MVMVRFVFLSVLLLASCAQVPSVRGDVERAVSEQNNQKDFAALMRDQGERITDRWFVDGNKIELLRDGAAAYPAMFAAIRHAHKRIDMESYGFDDEEGKKFADALIKRRRAGVKVNLIYDAWGSSDTSGELFDRLRRARVNVLEYNPIDPLNIVDTEINHRDHRKLLLIDGKTVFVGGVNISEAYKLKLKLKNYFGDSDDVDIDKLPWRDTQVRIEGPVVGEFESLFLQTWKDEKGDALPLPPPAPAAFLSGVSIQAIDGAPDSDRYTIYRSLIVAISLAHKSVHLTTAFFVPTPELVDALENAARRGVDVALIVPAQSTSDFALKAGRAYYQELMDAGVRIYERENAVLHAKTAVIDGVWSTVGSSNLDWRSVVFNNECNAVILGDGFGQQMETMFKDDIAQSKHIDPETWSDRSFWESLDEWKARIFEPLL
jgi:cardiolipin synthase A/B